MIFQIFFYYYLKKMCFHNKKYILLLFCLSFFNEYCLLCLKPLMVNFQ
ncbi:unknown [Bacteroides intestinalis CAG:315]|nr:unknown [Bacteroides intestinalis CAG:315]